MVVPLKLTQFYGHTVPRPRIYADVKFNEQRVDPPPSVNEALLSWASDAHWSMGGLSFKRLRAQGKVEGSVRKLRAFLEEDEDVAAATQKAKITTREAASKPDQNADKLKPTVAKEAGKSLEKKRQRSEEEFLETTPARKLRKKEASEGDSEGGSPDFVPATEDQSHRKMIRAESAVVSAHKLRKKTSRVLTTPELLKTGAPGSMALTGERRRENLFSSSGKTPGRSNSPAVNGNLPTESSPASKGGRLTRTGIQNVARDDANTASMRPSKGRPRARKVLRRGSLASDDDSSESDDGLEAFLTEKGRTLRRSSRLVKEEGSPSNVSPSALDSGSD